MEGVNDVDGVVAAAVSHPATPGFIAGKLARHHLGTVDGGTVDRLAAVFADADLAIAPLARSTLEAGLDGAGGPLVVAPVPWTILALRATGARPPARALAGMFRIMGQTPGSPPNVGGYPPASAWLSSSATAGRFSTAAGIAGLTPDDAPALDAARRGGWGELADLLLRPAGFTTPTLDALRDLPAAASRRPGEAALALALASPDLLIA